MKLVRIDALGPAELHPQLTLVRGASPERRRQLLELLEDLSRGGPESASGVVEVNGVALSLDRDTFAQLGLEHLNWVLNFDESAGTAERTGTSGPNTGRVVAPAPSVPATDKGGDAAYSQRLTQLDSLRSRLRDTAAERTELATRMEQVRERLDSFANAALEVCVGQIDALEARRSALRKQVDQRKSSIDERLRQMEATHRGHLAEIEAVRDLDLDGVTAARDRLAREIEQHSGPDPKSLELALRIDATMRRVRDLTGQAAAVSLRRREAEQRLAESVAELSALERALRRRSFDPAVVARLEEVRDELFADDERPSRLSVNRNRRRMLSLREEESRLLAELGFDTYSSYVMGIPSLRSEVEKSARVDHARAKVDEIQRELESMEEPADSLLAASEAELRGLLAEAAELVGSPPEARPPGSRTGAVSPAASSFEPLNAPTSDDVAHVIEQLRKAQLDGGPDGNDLVIAAAEDLREAIRSIASGRFSGADPTVPPRVAGSSIAAVAWNGGPSVLLGATNAWIERLGDTSSWLKAAGEAVDSLAEQIEELRGSSESAVELGEWAKVEAELDTLLDRMASAQERVRRNEDALVDLAELRESELVIRARERELLARISDVEQELRLAGAGTAAAGAEKPGVGPIEPARPSEAEPVGHLEQEADARAALKAASDPEWDLIRFAARRRSVSFAGSLPIVVMGFSALGSGRVVRATPGPGEAADASDRSGPVGSRVVSISEREAVFERVRRLSGVIQFVVVDDSEWLAGRIEALGMDARTIEL